MWPGEPKIRPRAWIENFDKSDQSIAAFLLDKFTFYNRQLTDELLKASFHSIGDGLPKGPQAPNSSDLINSLGTACFTLVTGENPNPTDSGYVFCRTARQLLRIPEENILNLEDAIKHAHAGNSVIFLDDFIGSGDQFLKTWNRIYGRTAPTSFSRIHKKNSFTAIYISLVSTDFGLVNIRREAPEVAVCVTHTLGDKYNIRNMGLEPRKQSLINSFLKKYSKRLTPNEDYMQSDEYKTYGYKSRGLLFGFEHSIPDATLPIFWSPGTNWEPLIERS